jgi:hypothetical protein
MRRNRSARAWIGHVRESSETSTIAYLMGFHHIALTVRDLDVA